MSKKKNKNKQKKQKVVYVDDGSTVVDMSAATPPKKKSSFKEKAHTYFSTVKKMVLPMLVTLLAFTIVFLIMYYAIR